MDESANKTESSAAPMVPRVLELNKEHHPEVFKHVNPPTFAPIVHHLTILVHHKETTMKRKTHKKSIDHVINTTAAKAKSRLKFYFSYLRSFFVVF